MDRQQRRHLAITAAMEAERLRYLAKLPNTIPIDPIEVAIKFGCEVRFLSLASLEGVYSPEPRPTIVLGSERPAGRRAYTCAHELGHHVFKHGMRVEDLNAQKLTRNQTPEEFLSNVFAGFLLMSQTAVYRALKDRGWCATSLEPDQMYRLANLFGVGYGTLVNHFSASLQIIHQEMARELLKVQPKQIKTQYEASGNSEVVIVDYYWRNRTVDLEVGDTVVFPNDADIEVRKQLQLKAKKDNSLIYIARTPGYARALCREREWAANIRISRKNYEGLAQYRFFEESEVEG